MYEYKAKVERVVDGDTLEVCIDLGFSIETHLTLRLNRIDAFETRLGPTTTAADKAKGLEAKEYLKGLFSEDPEIMIATIKDATEKYGRYLAEVTHHNLNINDVMVDMGFAVYKEY